MQKMYQALQEDANRLKPSLCLALFLSVPSEIPPSLGGGWIAQITGLRQ